MFGGPVPPRRAAGDLPPGSSLMMPPQKRQNVDGQGVPGRSGIRRWRQSPLEHKSHIVDTCNRLPATVRVALESADGGQPIGAKVLTTPSWAVLSLGGRLYVWEQLVAPDHSGGAGAPLAHVLELPGGMDEVVGGGGAVSTDAMQRVDMVEAGGPGGAKELLVLTPRGAGRHWRDVRRPQHNVDTEVALGPDEFVTCVVGVNRGEFVCGLSSGAAMWLRPTLSAPVRLAPARSRLGGLISSISSVVFTHLQFPHRGFCGLCARVWVVSLGRESQCAPACSLLGDLISSISSFSSVVFTKAPAVALAPVTALACLPEPPQDAFGDMGDGARSVLALRGLTLELWRVGEGASTLTWAHELGDVLSRAGCGAHGAQLKSTWAQELGDVLSRAGCGAHGAQPSVVAMGATAADGALLLVAEPLPAELADSDEDNVAMVDAPAAGCSYRIRQAPLGIPVGMNARAPESDSESQALQCTLAVDESVAGCLQALWVRPKSGAARLQADADTALGSARPSRLQEEWCELLLEAFGTAEGGSGAGGMDGALKHLQGIIAQVSSPDYAGGDLDAAAELASMDLLDSQASTAIGGGIVDGKQLVHKALEAKAAQHARFEALLRNAGLWGRLSGGGHAALAAHAEKLAAAAALCAAHQQLVASERDRRAPPQQESALALCARLLLDGMRSVVPLGRGAPADAYFAEVTKVRMYVILVARIPARRRVPLGCGAPAGAYFAEVTKAPVLALWHVVTDEGLLARAMSTLASSRPATACQLLCHLAHLACAPLEAALQRREEERSAGARPPLHRVAPWTSGDKVRQVQYRLLCLFEQMLPAGRADGSLNAAAVIDSCRRLAALLLDGYKEQAKAVMSGDAPSVDVDAWQRSYEAAKAGAFTACMRASDKDGARELSHRHLYFDGMVICCEAAEGEQPGCADGRKRLVALMAGPLREGPPGTAVPHEDFPTFVMGWLHSRKRPAALLEVGAAAVPDLLDKFLQSRGERSLLAVHRLGQCTICTRTQADAQRRFLQDHLTLATAHKQQSTAHKKQFPTQKAGPAAATWRTTVDSAVKGAEDQYTMLSDNDAAAAGELLLGLRAAAAARRLGEPEADVATVMFEVRQDMVHLQLLGLRAAAAARRLGEPEADVAQRLGGERRGERVRRVATCAIRSLVYRDRTTSCCSSEIHCALSSPRCGSDQPVRAALHAFAVSQGELARLWAAALSKTLLDDNNARLGTLIQDLQRDGAACLDYYSDSWLEVVAYASNLCACMYNYTCVFEVMSSFTGQSKHGATQHRHAQDLLRTTPLHRVLVRAAHEGPGGTGAGSLADDLTETVLEEALRLASGGIVCDNRDQVMRGLFEVLRKCPRE
ncbi:hypothetical protein JKP88DRAFT_263442 [Tribonema minus]|uniref:Nuclear pore complex protein Nup133 n=1 Tax=Tribonema minus TaxID=303371 RepID=A0A835YV83_9STRA|nr:hypothetical protein JKP88DRAFT_263442 [Tribonema minus]